MKIRVFEKDTLRMKIKIAFDLKDFLFLSRNNEI